MDLSVILFGAGQGIAFLSAGVIAYFKLNNKVYENQTIVLGRIIALETSFNLMGLSAAKLLHSPTDHLNLDVLLDKYIDRHYEMSFKEWDELRIRCEKTIDDESVSKDQRVLAAILAAICCHKLMLEPDRVKRLNFAKDLPSPSI